MKRILIISFLLISYVNFSQNPLAKQSFESSGDTWQPLELSTPSCSSNGDVWSPVTSLFLLFPSDGNQFWGIRDLDGNCGGNDYETITLPNVDVTGQSNLVFSFDYYADEFDAGEGLTYELFYDSISQGEVFVVEGTGGTSDNTNGWKTEIIPIPDTVGSVSVKLAAKCNNSWEIAGFDNVKIESSNGSSCQTALGLMVYESGASTGNELASDTSLTTPSSMSSTSCDESSFWSYNYDLFYNFTVPQGENSINILTGGENGNTIKVAVWDSCDGNIIFCSDEKSALHTVDGLTADTPYILQVWHDVSYFNNDSGPFTIALEKTPPAPENNNCWEATELIVGESNSENVVTGTTVGANDSRELPIPSCASYNGNDVWYTTTVPASGLLTVETMDVGDDLDMGMAIYTGSCGNLTEIACNDDIRYPNNLYSSIELEGYQNTTIYIRVWTYNNETHGNFNIVAYSQKCPYSTRWNGSKWIDGAPNSYTSAVFNGNYDTELYGSIETCDCDVKNSAIVNIAAGNFLTVHNDLTVEGILEVKNEGSLVMTNDFALVDVAGTVNVHKTTTTLNNFRDFTYWSSPVEDAAISDVFTGVNLNRVFLWRKPDTNYFGGWLTATGSMNPAEGYIAEAPSTTAPGEQHSVVFTGTPNNGEINVALGHAGTTEDYDGFNLVGNPYPSAINVEEFINAAVDGAEESNLDITTGTIWLWTHNTAISNGLTGEFLGDDYATVNLSGGTQAATLGATPDYNLASGQGFFVKAEKKGDLHFNNAMRIKEEGLNNLFFRDQDTKKKVATTSNKNRIWLDLKTTEGGAFNQLLLGFFDNATDGFDKGYDGERMSAGWISFYSLLDDAKYAIQGLGSFSAEKEIILGFDTYIDKNMTYEISIANIEGSELTNSDIILVDNLLDIQHDLRESDYQFSAENAGSFKDRFTLKFTSVTLDVTKTPQEELRELVISSKDAYINLISNQIITNVQVYDLLGRSLLVRDTNDSNVILPIHRIVKGTPLLINVQLEDSKVITKKIILQ